MRLKQYQLNINTWRLADTGLAASHTVCHVLPGISIRELNLPFIGWFVSSISRVTDRN